MRTSSALLVLVGALSACATVPVPVIVKAPARTQPAAAMTPCEPLPLLPARVATEPLDQAARDILSTVKQTQTQYLACSAKQKAEADWIKG